MQIKLINIGFGSIVNANRLIAIVSSESAPIKRKIQEARESGMLVDATYGRKTRAVLIADSGQGSCETISLRPLNFCYDAAAPRGRAARERILFYPTGRI